MANILVQHAVPTQAVAQPPTSVQADPYSINLVQAADSKFNVVSYICCTSWVIVCLTGFGASVSDFLRSYLEVTRWLSVFCVCPAEA